jgi:hypothetical protein
MSKKYHIEWKTSDELLDCVLNRYITSGTLSSMLQKATDIETLFGIECTVGSDSGCTERQRMCRRENIDCDIVWHTDDDQLNDILYIYCVSDKKAVRRLFGRI